MHTTENYVIIVKLLASTKKRCMNSHIIFDTLMYYALL